MIKRCFAALIACLAAALCAWLAMRHPLSPMVALAGLGFVALVVCIKPLWWPTLLLTLLPLIGLMPWTGWVLVEELDLVILAVAAGAYLHLALTSAPTPSGPPGRPHAGAQSLAHRGWRARNTSWAWLWLLPLAASTVLALFRGFHDAGEFSMSFWQGYREPLNSLRLAKPLFAAVLLLPLWLALQRLDGPTARQALTHGLLGLLAGTALGVWWERLAFTGLLNFSSDYRATGAFWEMHVGGAALDALLVAGLPFCTVALMRERRPLQFAVLGALLGLAAYAALVTFSRIVYLAAPVAVLLAWWLQTRQSVAQATGQPATPKPWRDTLVAAGWMVLTVPVAMWLFPVAGYRGLLAWMGAACCVLLLGPRLFRASGRVLLLGAALGLLGGVLVVALAWALPKGAYWAYTAAWLLTVLSALRRPSPESQVLSLGGVLIVLTALVTVAVVWGGELAWTPSVGVALGLLVILLLSTAAAAPAWPQHWPWQALVATGMVTICAVMAVFSGGAYMGSRMTATASDTSTRTEHWSRSLSWLNTTETVLGKGLGRYVSNYTLSGRVEDQVGDLRLLANGDTPGTQAVALSSGKHLAGFGGMYRLSQRVAMPVGTKAKVSLLSRNALPVDVVVEICEKHLLYHETCMHGRRILPATQGAWVQQAFDMVGKTALTSGLVVAPRMAVFSVGLPSPGQRVEISNLRFEDASGRSLLSNGAFENGLAHWFTSSDHHHMPWHAKNLAVHLLFEQGYLGLLGFCLAAGAALWRVTVGAARTHPVSPALAGALLGVLLVGAVDSLLDMPRVAFVVWMLLLASLSLPKVAPTRLGVPPGRAPIGTPSSRTRPKRLPNSA